MTLIDKRREPRADLPRDTPVFRRRRAQRGAGTVGAACFKQVGARPNDQKKRRLPDQRPSWEILMPSSSSAIDWQQIHGARLVCVRHRVTPDGLQRVTTVELVVAVDPLRRRHAAELDETVTLRLDLRVRAHRAALQGIGARWDACRLGLAAHIVE